MTDGFAKGEEVVPFTTHEYHIKLQKVFVKEYTEMVCKCITLEELMTMGPNKSSPRVGGSKK